MKMNQRVKELSQSSKYGERVRLLRTVPGIGTLIAMELLVELQDMERFKRADELASYIGLTPHQLKQFKGAKRAIIAIARKLIIRVRRILLNNEPYVIGVC